MLIFTEILKTVLGDLFDTKPVGNGGGKCQELSCEGIDDCGENTALFQLSSISLPM